MRTNIPTLLSLQEWAEIVGWDRFFLSQISLGIPGLPLARGCSSPTYQRPGPDDDRLSREEIAGAIFDAEELFQAATDFWPAPKYTEGESIQYPRPARLDNRGVMKRWDGYLKSITTNNRYVRNIGVQTWTQIDASATVTARDYDNDSFSESFSVSATVPAGTLAGELHLFYKTADRAGVYQDKQYWEIRPVHVDVTGTTATFRGFRNCLVTGALQEAYNPSALDAGDSIYVTEVEVWRETFDKSIAGSLLWEAEPNHSLPNTITTSTATFNIRDKDAGILVPRPATWDATNSQFVLAGAARNRAPDRVTISYQHGFPRDSSGRMDRRLARIITKLSCSLLAKDGCGCERAHQTLAAWQKYPSEGTNSRTTTFMITKKHLEAPWGARVGAIEAWNETLKFLDTLQ